MMSHYRDKMPKPTAEDVKQIQRMLLDHQKDALKRLQSSKLTAGGLTAKQTTKSCSKCGKVLTLTGKWTFCPMCLLDSAV